MGYEIEINVKDAIGKLDKATEEMKTKISEGTRDAGFYIEGEVKASIAGQRGEPTSVDTGNFLNSVTTEAEGINTKVYSDVEYAKYLEYGTSRINPRRHFQNSLIRNKDKIKEYIAKKIKEI
jgi:HK97 gp10 family phage protein